MSFYFSFKLHVEEERYSATGEREVRIHYPGWHRKFDEWRKVEDMVDFGEEFVKSNAHNLLKSTICIQVKEALNGSRLQDPDVTLHIAVQLDTFRNFIENIQPVEKVQRGLKNIYRLKSITHAAKYFGDNWWYRVLDTHGDCCHIVPGTLQIWMSERQPLIEFSLQNSKPQQTYQGYLLVIGFVRDTKSKTDMLSLISEINKGGL